MLNKSPTPYYAVRVLKYKASPKYQTSIQPAGTIMFGPFI